jgi:hypothetical protein
MPKIRLGAIFSRAYEVKSNPHFPRPTDSILQRHDDALVAVERENRLAAIAG